MERTGVWVPSENLARNSIKSLVQPRFSQFVIRDVRKWKEFIYLEAHKLKTNYF